MTLSLSDTLVKARSTLLQHASVACCTARLTSMRVVCIPRGRLPLTYSSSCHDFVFSVISYVVHEETETPSTRHPSCIRLFTAPLLVFSPTHRFKPLHRPISWRRWND